MKKESIILAAALGAALVSTGCGGGSDGGNGGSSSSASSQSSQSSGSSSAPAAVYTDREAGLVWTDDAQTGSVEKRWLTPQNRDACAADRTSAACEDTSGDTAAAYCESLTLGGFTDWELPDSDELLYLAHSGKAAEFTHEPIGPYWSSDVNSDPLYAGYVFIDPDNDAVPNPKQDKGSVLNVLCVRHITPEPVPPLTYSDTTAKRMWQDDVDSMKVRKPWMTETNFMNCLHNTGSCTDTSGDTAATYCKNLTLSGYDDWRLPTYTELLNLRESGNWHSLGHVVEGRNYSDYLNVYLTSDTMDEGRTLVHTVVFSDDSSEPTVLKFQKRNKGYVRCVRDLP